MRQQAAARGIAFSGKDISLFSRQPCSASMLPRGDRFAEGCDWAIWRLSDWAIERLGD
jgi:hypothetical protein